MIEKNGKKIKDSWSEITISDYYQIKDILDSKNMNALEKQLKILVLTSDITVNNLNELSIIEANEYLECMEYLKYEPAGKLKEFYLINDKKYKLLNDFKQLTAGQFIDLEHYKNEGIEENIVEILSCLLLPVRSNEKKTGFFKELALQVNFLFKKSSIEKTVEKYMETKREVIMDDIFNYMVIEDAMSIMVFFCLILILSMETIRFCSEEEAKKQLKLTLPTLNEKVKKQIGKEKLEMLDGFIKNGIGLPQ